MPFFVFVFNTRIFFRNYDKETSFVEMSSTDQSLEVVSVTSEHPQRGAADLRGSISLTRNQVGNVRSMSSRIKVSSRLLPRGQGLTFPKVTGISILSTNMNKVLCF